MKVTHNVFIVRIERQGFEDALPEYGTLSGMQAQADLSIDDTP